MITLARFKHLEAELRRRGHGAKIDWSENIGPVDDADTFADHVIYVICNSGMKVTIGDAIYRKCMAAIDAGLSAASVYGHPGKAPAIDHIWHERESLFAAFLDANDKVECPPSAPMAQI